MTQKAWQDSLVSSAENEVDVKANTFMGHGKKCFTPNLLYLRHTDIAAFLGMSISSPLGTFALIYCTSLEKARVLLSCPLQHNFKTVSLHSEADYKQLPQSLAAYERNVLTANASSA